ncbi:MAG: C40 family peptidase [candidate division Zixibacteria bacterium]|nr:C40 family peptidase [candidate division Zixibacteria bacterium]
MKIKRILFLSFLMATIVFNAGCGLRQKYRVDKDGDNPNKTNSQTKRTSNNNQSVNKDGSTVHLIELGRIIQSYLGRPYSGKSRYTKGFDCSQFMQELFGKYNDTKLPRTVKKQIKYGTSVSKNDIQYGDLVFFRTDGRKPSHVGVYVGFDEFVHSSTSSGIIISSLKNKYWKKRFLGGRRIIR